MKKFQHDNYKEKDPDKVRALCLLLFKDAACRSVLQLLTPFSLSPIPPLQEKKRFLKRKKLPPPPPPPPPGGFLIPDKNKESYTVKRALKAAIKGPYREVLLPILNGAEGKKGVGGAIRTCTHVRIMGSLFMEYMLKEICEDLTRPQRTRRTQALEICEKVYPPPRASHQASRIA